MPAEPRDRCPYPRPFVDGFDECPAYQKSQFVPLNSMFLPMESVWTCSHLDVRALTGDAVSFYARCRLGDEAARMRWVDEAHRDRLADIRSFQDDLSAETRELVERMWALKGRQVEALSSGRDAGEATAELRSLSAVYLRTIDAFLEERTPLLDRVHLPPATVFELFETVVEIWVSQPDAGPVQIPDEIVDRFPEDARILLRPREQD